MANTAKKLGRIKSAAGRMKCRSGGDRNGIKEEAGVCSHVIGPTYGLTLFRSETPQPIKARAGTAWIRYEAFGIVKGRDIGDRDPLAA